MIAACKTDDDMRNERHAERTAGTAGTEQRNFDDEVDSQGSTMEAGYGYSSHSGASTHTSPGSTAPATAGTAGTAQRDFDDRHDSGMTQDGDESKDKSKQNKKSGTPGSATGSTATTTSQSYGGSTGPSASRTAGTAGTSQRDFDDRDDSREGMTTKQSSSSSSSGSSDRVAGTAGTSQRNYDDRDDSLGGREMERQGLAGGTGVTEASARTRDDVDAATAISAWPSVAQAAARAMIAKYGQPDAVTEDAVMWKNNGPWKKTVVHRMETEHNFPVPHKDVLEQKIEMRVPADKIDDLAEFDGSISVNRTKGTVSVVCDKEENNFVALNLANDIVTGKRSVEQARAMLAQTATQVQNGQKPDIAQRLTFDTSRGNAGDPDARFDASGAMRNGSGVIDGDARSKSSSRGTSNPASKTQKDKDTRDLDEDGSIDKNHPNKPHMDEKPDKPGEQPDEKDDLDKPGF